MNFRPEYQVINRLAWDAEFRRRFLSDAQGALGLDFPSLPNPERFGAWQRGGIEDEAFRRMADLCRGTRTIFSKSFRLLEVYGGEKFFEEVLRTYLQAGGDANEPFALPRIAPRVMEVARSFAFSDEGQHTLTLMEYDFARFTVRRAIQERWSEADGVSPFVAGATFFSADFDLFALLAETERLEAASAPAWTVRQRLRPSPGRFRGVVFPKRHTIVEAEIEDELFALLLRSRNQATLTQEEVGEGFQALLETGVLRITP